MIYTVRGPIDKTQMGRTLSHEHLDWIFDQNFASRMYFGKQYDEDYNQKIFDKVLPIISGLREAGCQTIVEASPPLGGQNLKLLYDLSFKTNINIIASTGINITKYAYHIFPEKFEEQLAKKWIQDFEEGLDVIDNVCIKPGHIKLLLERGGVNNVDKAMLKAAAIACKATGMSIHCHVLEAEHMPKVMKILEKMEVPPHKFVWAHADYESNREMILEVVKKGYWIGFDTIQAGKYEERKELIDHALEHNYSHQVILSEDYDFYAESKKKDGIERYCAFFNVFVPYCIENGIPQDVIESMIVDNPARFYDI
ncbi:TatD family hydrolase [Serpentinicella alkaliphila]|uniref:Phosphotriesterase-related protein n=1 Tax=Serpentinicella alkaliphila TaxID=1734049 RepID=A0A4R2TZS4_9FIRM|nr:TatD family hydrolase [Serpentinicella alkaliphila]QUH25216.1 TatD family hydrolase [Serpentinicella alkaliphila]TCQ07025.1 phosphotriesterase-related protein [Serpentinicella alkaliphila]